MGGTQFTLCDCCSNAGCLQHVVCQADGTLVAQSFQRTAIAGKGKRTALRLASCLLLDDPPHRQRRGDHCLLDPSRSGEVSGSARSPVTTVRRSDSGKPAGPRSGRRLGGRHNLPRGRVVAAPRGYASEIAINLRPASVARCQESSEHVSFSSFIRFRP